MKDRFPLPWVHYTGKLRPQFPTRIHEIHAANGETVIPWGGFDQMDATDRERAVIAKRIVEAVNEHDELRETVMLPLKHANLQGKTK